jgi:ABC-type polysaccharide/polyol phosphate export permease
MLPALFRWLILLNPFHILIRPMQVVVYSVSFPLLEAVGYGMAVASATTMAAYAVHRRLHERVIFYV